MGGGIATVNIAAETATRIEGKAIGLSTACQVLNIAPATGLAC